MKTSSKTDRAYLKNLPDDEIDLSDAPELTPELAARARLLMPGQRTSEATPRNAPTSERKPVKIELEIDPVLLAWFQLQGEDYQQTMRDALLQYAQAHKPAAS